MVCGTLQMKKNLHLCLEIFVLFIIPFLNYPFGFLGGALSSDDISGRGAVGSSMHTAESGQLQI